MIFGTVDKEMTVPYSSSSKPYSPLEASRTCIAELLGGWVTWKGPGGVREQSRNGSLQKTSFHWLGGLGHLESSGGGPRTEQKGVITRDFFSLKAPLESPKFLESLNDGPHSRGPLQSLKFLSLMDLFERIQSQTPRGARKRKDYPHKELKWSPA